MASIYAQAMWDALPEYIRDADGDGDLLAYLSGVGDTLDQGAAVIRAGADLGDPALVPRPWLEWLAALGGVDVTGVSDADLRAFVVGSIQSRGSVAAIQARVGVTLTGTRTVEVECPYTTANTIRVTTFSSETPDTGARDAAAALEVPAWLVLTTRTLAGMTYTTMSGRYTPYSVMTATGKTYTTLTAEV